jgi:hypothetical protein
MLQFYAEHLGTSNAAVLLDPLKLLNETHPKWQRPCSCRTGRKLRECHADVIRRLRARIPAAVRSSTLTSIRATHAVPPRA